MMWQRIMWPRMISSMEWLDREAELARAIEIVECARDVAVVDPVHGPRLAVARAAGRERERVIDVRLALRVGRAVLVAAEERHVLALGLVALDERE